MDAVAWAFSNSGLRSRGPKLESPQTVEERSGVERLTAEQLADYQAAAAKVRKDAADARAACKPCVYLDVLVRVANTLDKRPHEVVNHTGV